MGTDVNLCWKENGEVKIKLLGEKDFHALKVGDSFRIIINLEE